MKKIVLVLILSLGILGACGNTASNVDESKDVTETNTKSGDGTKKATTKNLYEVGKHIRKGEPLDTDGEAIYYFYQDSCKYCIELKPKVTEFYNKELETDDKMYFVDVANLSNSDFWAQDDFNQAEIKAKIANGQNVDPDEIKITGTPSMVVFEDGQATEYLVGNDDITEFMGV